MWARHRRIGELDEVAISTSDDAAAQRELALAPRVATKQTEAGKPPTKEAVLAMHKFNEELEKAGLLPSYRKAGLSRSKRYHARSLDFLAH